MQVDYISHKLHICLVITAVLSISETGLDWIGLAGLTGKLDPVQFKFE